MSKTKMKFQSIEQGDKVKIKSTGILAKVVSIGQRGLLLLNSDKFGMFDRTVYSPKEIEEVTENE